MQAIRSWVLVGSMAAALGACGGGAHKKPGAPRSGAGQAGTGTGAIDQGDAGADQGDAGQHGDAGNGSAAEGGRGGTAGMATRGGAGGGVTSGGAGSGTTGGGGVPAGGRGPVAGSGGDGAPSAGWPPAGAGGGTTIEPPPDCASVNQSVSADACSYEYTCEGRTHFDSCTRDTDGTWACECGTFADATRYFELTGVAAPDVCGAVARICERDDIPVSPTRTCVRKEHGVDGDTCASHATCGHVLEFEDGIVVREVEHYRAKCELEDNFIADAYDCSCEGGAFNRERDMVTAPSVDEVCLPMLEYCTAEQTPTFTKPVCGYAAPSGAVDQACTNATCGGCLMAQECGKAVELARNVEMVSFADAKYSYVVCLPKPAGDFTCTCRTTLEGLYGDATISQAVLDECRNAGAVCAR